MADNNPVSFAEKARALFLEGYNCAQAVFCAFEDVTGLDRESAAKLSSSFGGGMGRLREVCGGMSAALMVLGMREGYADPADPEAKKKHYARVREFAERFRAAEGSIICRELLENGMQGTKAEIGGDPEARTAEYYEKRPCPGIVYEAARILAEMLGEEEEKERA